MPWWINPNENCIFKWTLQYMWNVVCTIVHWVNIFTTSKCQRMIHKLNITLTQVRAFVKNVWIVLQYEFMFITYIYQKFPLASWKKLAILPFHPRFFFWKKHYWPVFINQMSWVIPKHELLCSLNFFFKDSVGGNCFMGGTFPQLRLMHTCLTFHSL